MACISRSPSPQNPPSPLSISPDAEEVNRLIQLHRGLSHTPSTLPAADLPDPPKSEDSDGRKGGGEESSQINSKIRERVRPTWVKESNSPIEDDGHVWRKYGLKIYSNYRRHHYTCTHRNTHGCRAVKQVEQISEDPPLYRTKYRGHHTCSPPPENPDSSTLLSLGGSPTIINPGDKQEQSTLSTNTTYNYNICNEVDYFWAPNSSPAFFAIPDFLRGPVSDEGNVTKDHPLISEPEVWQRYPSNVSDDDEPPNDSIMEEIMDFFSILFLIPTDYEFEEDTLVQLWMAKECIKDESMGQERFNFLLSGEYLLQSGANFVTRKARYQINTTKIKDYLDLQRDVNRSSYLKWENESQRNITNSTEIQHVSLVCNDFDASVFQTLKQFTELKTLLFLCNYGEKVTQVPDHLFLSLQKLQALDLSGTHIKKLSSFVGNLIHLRYLDLSWTLIEWLPDIICSLDELQTLKLRGCSKLRGLPRQLKKLTKLRHLDVDVLRQLATIPGGIGSLVNLRTLSAFLVGTEDGCKIQELKELNSLTGDFCIAVLENVGNGDEAKEAALNNKQYLKKLELRWTASQLLRTNNNCYDVLKCLQPYSSLKELQIFCYEGSTFPGWVGDPTFNQLVSITFFRCEHVLELPLVEQLPFLKHLELVKMNGVKKIERRGKSEHAAFFRLEKLEVDEMQSLRSWNWTTTNDDDFRSLVELTINDCPGLREFHVLPCLSSIKHLEVRGCPKLESLSETKLPDSLEDLIVEGCPVIKRKCSQQGGEDWLKIQHVSNIRICEDNEDDDDDDDEC